MVQVVGTSQDYPIVVVPWDIVNSFFILKKFELCIELNIECSSLQLHTIGYLPLGIYRSVPHPTLHFGDGINFSDWGRKNVTFPHLGQFGVKHSPLNEINVTSAFRNLQYLQVK